jgi:hypothetical protein
VADEDARGADAPRDESFVDVARLYVGNILYAIEMVAVSLDEQGRREDAAWYRGLARKLAEAYGREKDAPRD